MWHWDVKIDKRARENANGVRKYSTNINLWLYLRQRRRKMAKKTQRRVRQLLHVQSTVNIMRAGKQRWIGHAGRTEVNGLVR